MATVTPNLNRQTVDFKQAGRTAFKLGLTSFDCKMKPGTPQFKLWLTGYAEAKQEHNRRYFRRNHRTPLHRTIGG